MRIRIILLLLLSLIGTKAHSQINIMGKPGYINTPSAEWMQEKPLGFSYSHLPGDYSMFANEKTNIFFYNARANFTSFFSVNLSIAHRPSLAEIDRLGVGDRQLDFRFKILKEKKYLPSLVLGLTLPGSVAPYLSHDYLVLTKNFTNRLGHFNLSAGYGSPYVILKKPGSDSYLDFSIQKKDETRLNSSYLAGFFGGLSYRPVSFGGVMVEYDSNTINAGAFIQPWEWLILQGTTYEGKEFAFNVALNFSLNFLPSSLRKHENVQD